VLAPVGLDARIGRTHAGRVQLGRHQCVGQQLVAWVVRRAVLWKRGWAQ
jgi:hypothetical protein